MDYFAFWLGGVRYAMPTRPNIRFVWGEPFTLDKKKATLNVSATKASILGGRGAVESYQSLLDSGALKPLILMQGGEGFVVFFVDKMDIGDPFIVRSGLKTFRPSKAGTLLDEYTKAWVQFPSVGKISGCYIVSQRSLLGIPG